MQSETIQSIPIVGEPASANDAGVAGAAVSVETPVDESALLRAAAWERLAALFAHAPDQAQLDVLQQIPVNEAPESPLELAWEMLREASTRLSPDTIRDEYFALFIGLGRGEVVPFGSWYLTGFLMEKPLAVLREDLARLGIERKVGVSETEDHIAALADCMALMIRNPGQWPEPVQQTFYKDHLEPWGLDFMTDVQQAASADFYRAAACLGEHLIRLETQWMELAP